MLKTSTYRMPDGWQSRIDLKRLKRVRNFGVSGKTYNPGLSKRMIFRSDNDVFSEQDTQFRARPFFWRIGECRVFVSVSRSFLGRFQKFKDVVGEHVKTILTSLVAAQTYRQKI